MVDIMVYTGYIICLEAVTGSGGRYYDLLRLSIVGCYGVVWLILWFTLVAETPATHPRISAVEKQYINQTVGSGRTTADERRKVRHQPSEIFCISHGNQSEQLKIIINVLVSSF